MAFDKILSFVILIMHRSGSHCVLKRTCRRGRLFPCLLLPVDFLALSLVSWRWVARNVVRFGGQDVLQVGPGLDLFIMETGCYRIVEVPLRSYLKSHGLLLQRLQPERSCYLVDVAEDGHFRARWV
jgi:ABC-type uncharacterized transport system permease subunit